MVTAQEAKKILLERRRRARERQAEYVAKMREQGFRRIAVMISGEAYQALDAAAKESDKTKSELVSDIISEALINKTSGKSVPRGTDISTNASVPRGTTAAEPDKLILQYRGGME